MLCASIDSGAVVECKPVALWLFDNLMGCEHSSYLPTFVKNPVSLADVTHLYPAGLSWNRGVKGEKFSSTKGSAISHKGVTTCSGVAEDIHHLALFGVHLGERESDRGFRRGRQNAAPSL